jgi:hypothetical protein
MAAQKSTTAKSSQAVLNKINSTGRKSMTEQELANGFKSQAQHKFSFQELLNAKNGTAQHSLSEQEALFSLLKTRLSLTGSATRYSVQELLSMADADGIALSDIL